MLTVSNPLQQQSTNVLQGSSPAPLQGNAQPIQGGAVAAQGAPAVQTVVTPPATTVKKTAPVQTVQPAVQPASQPVQQFGFLNEQAQFDPNTGQSTVVPNTPTPPAPAPGQTLAQNAAAAGLSADDYLKLISGQSTLSQADQKAIKDNLGIDTLATSLFAPTPSSQQTYTDAYNAAGLADIKTKFDALQKQINDAHGKLTDATGTVNENPWLSEASRVGRVKRLNDQATAEIGNLVNQAQQYADLYNNGITEVNGVVTRAGTDATNNQNLKQAQLTYLEKQAQDQIAAKQADNSSKLSRYLPDFLAAKAKSSKPDTIGSDNTGYYSWDPSTSTFKQVIAPSPTLPDSAKEYEYAKKNGYTGTYSQYQNEDANRKASIARAGISGGLNAAQTSAAFKLADDYDKASGNFDQVTSNYNRVLASAKNPSAAGDLALIFSYMKTLDPTSVVREGEFATAASAGSVPDRITAQYNKIINGERLSDTQRSDFVSRATSLYQTAETQQKQVDNTYASRAGQFGIPANYVIRDRSSASNPTGGTSLSVQDAINTYVP